MDMQNFSDARTNGLPKEQILQNFEITENHQNRGYKSKFQPEIEAILAQFGDLETIRRQLNLSRRQICNLLLVHPSSWTKWTNLNPQKKINPPPYIFRALQWYMLLNDKFPGTNLPPWPTRSSGNIDKNLSKLKEELLITKNEFSEKLNQTYNLIDKDKKKRFDSSILLIGVVILGFILGILSKTYIF